MTFWLRLSTARRKRGLISILVWVLLWCFFYFFEMSIGHGTLSFRLAAPFVSFVGACAFYLTNVLLYKKGDYGPDRNAGGLLRFVVEQIMWFLLAFLVSVVALFVFVSLGS